MSKFKKTDRLLSEGDFRSLLNRAHRVSRSEEGILKLNHFKVFRDPKAGPMRVGFTIPKKVVKSAVERNRVKRVLREFFRMNKTNIEGEILVKLERAPERLDFLTLTKPLDRILKAKVAK